MFYIHILFLHLLDWHSPEDPCWFCIYIQPMYTNTYSKFYIQIPAPSTTESLTEKSLSLNPSLISLCVTY